MNSPLAAFFEFEMFYCISDINYRPVDPCFDQGLIEQLARRPHERPAGEIFLVTRLLADHNKPCRGGTLSNTA